VIKKTSDLKDEFILELLADHQGQWAFLHDDGSLSWHEDTQYTFKSPYKFEGIVSPKIILSKFKSLYKRDLCGGCVCGCRGDFEITDKGLQFIGRNRTKRYTGY